MKKRKSSDRKDTVETRQAYDRIISFLLLLLVFLIPLKFGVPNLDAGSPNLPTDLLDITQYLKKFFQAVFSLRLASAVGVVSEAVSNPWPEEIAQILILLVLFLWGVKSFSQRSLILRVGKVDAMMWLFVLAGFIATVLSPGVHSSMVILRQFVSYAVLYFVIVHAVDSPQQQKRILKFFLISTAIVAWLALYQFFVGFEETARVVRQRIAPELQDAYLARIARRRVFSVFVYPNSLAGFLLVSFPLTLFYGAMQKEWFSRKNRKKLIAYVVVLPLTCFVSFLLTQSKASYLTFFLIGVASVIAARKRLGLRPRAVAVILVVSLAIVSVILITPLGRKLLIEKGGFTLSERLGYWKTGARMIPRSPVIGNGLNSFGLLYPRYQLPGTGEARNAHNNFLQVLVETGAIGLIFFVAFWVLGLAVARSFVRGYLRGEKGDRLREMIVLSAVMGISCFLIHSFADFDLYIPGIAMTVWLFLGLMVRSAGPEEGRRIELTQRSSTAWTLALVVVCGLGVFYSAKTLNASSHLAMAQYLVERTDPPPGYEEYDAAIAEVEKALKWDRSNPNLHLYLGRLYVRLKQNDEALKAYAVADRLLHNLSPMIAHRTSRTLLAQMEAKGKVDWDRVLNECRKAASRSPASPFHRLVYAYSLNQAGRLEESHRELQNARELDRSGWEAIKTAVTVYRDDPLVDDLKSFFETGPGSPDSRKSSPGEKAPLQPSPNGFLQG